MEDRYSLKLPHTETRKAINGTHVKLETYHHTSRLVQNEVPQGSSLEPLLFIYSINRLIELTNSDSIIIFADEVVIYYGMQN